MLARSLHTEFLAAIHDQRRFGAVSPSTSARLTAAQQAFANDIDVVNYALTLEHLESAFYKLAAQYTFGADPFGNSIAEWLGVIGGHEDAHVEALTGVVKQLGGEPVAAAEYDFGVTDAASFLATAAAVENLGVAAYDGAGSSIQSPDILLAAGGIVAVEARHAAYLNVVTGMSPFPAAVETPQTPQEVLDTAGPFIVSGT
ncbi:MAG: ferritin-like domain-containing protein [Thermomicrobiales bacterium]